MGQSDLASAAVLATLELGFAVAGLEFEFPLPLALVINITIELHLGGAFAAFGLEFVFAAYGLEFAFAALGLEFVFVVLGLEFALPLALALDVVVKLRLTVVKSNDTLKLRLGGIFVVLPM